MRVAVATAAVWPQQRRKDSTVVDDGSCPRCHAASETEEHVAWQCSANTGHADYKATARLVGQAVAGVQQCPALWLRGLLPADHLPAAALPQEKGPQGFGPSGRCFCLA